MTHPDLAEPNRTRHPKTEESNGPIAFSAYGAPVVLAGQLLLQYSIPVSFQARP